MLGPGGQGRVSVQLEADVSEQQLVELARKHGLRVQDDGSLWGHMRGLMSLARTLVHAENQACEHAVGEGAGIFGHGECAEIIRKRRQA